MEKQLVRSESTRMERHSVLKESMEIESIHLQRLVKLDCFLPTSVTDPASMELLLINDGQNMEELGLHAMLEKLSGKEGISNLLCVGIHAGDRMMEYGTACRLDYEGRGNRAKSYTRFILDELVPFIMATYRIPSFRHKSFAGFSMGALSALDIVWNHPHEFTRVGVFSGSLWWRTKSLGTDYNDDTDRIMHTQIRKGKYVKGMKFFLQTGSHDEKMDRNNNGIIDSIDDTLDLINELVAKGYHSKKDVKYLELQDGYHDIATWAKAMPEFLKWGWGRKVRKREGLKKGASVLALAR